MYLIYLIYLFYFIFMKVLSCWLDYKKNVISDTCVCGTFNNEFFESNTILNVLQLLEYV